MDNKEAVKVIRSNWPDLKYSMLRDALELSIKLLVAEEPAQQTTNKQMVSAAQIATQVKLLYEDAPPREYSREEVIVILKQLHHL